MFEEIFIILSFCLTILIWVAQFLTELQIFNKPILFSVTLAILFFCILAVKNKKIQPLSKIDLLAFIVVLFFALFNTYYAHETFFGGRDDGLYANQATYIAKNHTFYIKNPVVSSFPGHIEINEGLRIPFYLGYPSWLALNTTFFGIESVKYSNFILLLIGLLSLYFLGKRISGSKISLISIIVLFTIYPMLWFTRKTFSENLAFTLVWFGMLCLFKAYERKNGKYLIPTIFSFGLLLTVRVEAIALIITFILLLIFLYFIKKQRWIFSKQIFVLFLIALTPALWYNIATDTRYVNSFLSTIKNFFINFFSQGVTSTTKSLDAAVLSKNALEFNIPDLTWRLLSFYNLLLPIFFIPIAFLKTIKFRSKKQTNLVWMLFFLIFPQLFYLLNPLISLDQPWFLRRFLPIIFPAAFIFFGYVIKDLSKKLILLIYGILIISNIIIALPIISFREYEAVLAQLSKINNTGLNKETSLILTDYVNLGNYKIAEPLFYVFDYNTVAVVPFSIKSLLTGVNISEPILYNEGAFKIPNICKYTSIYLLTNKDINKSLKNEFNQEDLAPVWETNISYPELTKECELFRLTKNQTIPEIAHINIETAKEYCDAIPNKVGKANLTLELLKINTLLTQSLHIRDCESK